MVWRPGGLVIWLFYDLEISERAGAGQRERERERERWVATGSSRCANLGASRGGPTRARARALAVVTVLEPAVCLEAAQIGCGCRDSFGAGCMP